MLKKLPDKTERELIDKIIRVAWVDAGIIERITVQWKAVRDNNVKHLLAEYKSTAKRVHNLKQTELPDYITQKVRNQTSIQIENESIFQNILYGFFSFISGKTVQLTAAGILILATVSFFIFREPSPSHKYTATEIELAEKQLKHSLAIVGKVFEKAERGFTVEVLDKKVNRTLSKGYYLVNNILIGG